jgi:hypothetical protein
MARRRQQAGTDISAAAMHFDRAARLSKTLHTERFATSLTLDTSLNAERRLSLQNFADLRNL